MWRGKASSKLWCTPVTPAFQRRKHEAQKFKVNLRYIVSLKLTWATGDPVSRKHRRDGREEGKERKSERARATRWLSSEKHLSPNLMI